MLLKIRGQVDMPLINQKAHTCGFVADSRWLQDTSQWSWGASQHLDTLICGQGALAIREQTRITAFHNNELRLVNAYCDYSLWYASPEGETNLVIVEAKALFKWACVLYTFRAQLYSAHTNVSWQWYVSAGSPSWRQTVTNSYSLPSKTNRTVCIPS